MEQAMHCQEQLALAGPVARSLETVQTQPGWARKGDVGHLKSSAGAMPRSTTTECQQRGPGLRERFDADRVHDRVAGLGPNPRPRT